MNLKNKIDINFAYPLCVLLTLGIAKIVFWALEVNVWLSAFILLSFAFGSSVPYFWKVGKVDKPTCHLVWLLMVAGSFLGFVGFTIFGEVTMNVEKSMVVGVATAVAFYLNLKLMESFTMQSKM